MDKSLNSKTIPESLVASVSVSAILPQDLRIGNIVILKSNCDKDEIAKLLTIDEIQGCYYNRASNKKYINRKYDGKNSWCTFKIIHSIPITEELLLKIGAIKLDFKDFPSFNLFGTQINFIDGIWIDYASRIEIKGLHHLQNVFYFRNSFELQIGSLAEH